MLALAGRIVPIVPQWVATRLDWLVPVAIAAISVLTSVFIKAQDVAMHAFNTCLTPKGPIVCGAAAYIAIAFLHEIINLDLEGGKVYFLHAAIKLPVVYAIAKYAPHPLASAIVCSILVECSHVLLGTHTRPKPTEWGTPHKGHTFYSVCEPIVKLFEDEWLLKVLRVLGYILVIYYRIDLYNILSNISGLDDLWMVLCNLRISRVYTAGFAVLLLFLDNRDFLPYYLSPTGQRAKAICKYFPKLLYRCVAVGLRAVKFIFIFLIKAIVRVAIWIKNVAPRIKNAVLWTVSLPVKVANAVCIAWCALRTAIHDFGTSITNFVVNFPTLASTFAYTFVLYPAAYPFIVTYLTVRAICSDVVRTLFPHPPESGATPGTYLEDPKDMCDEESDNESEVEVEHLTTVLEPTPAPESIPTSAPEPKPTSAPEPKPTLAPVVMQSGSVLTTPPVRQDSSDAVIVPSSSTSAVAAEGSSVEDTPSSSAQVLAAEPSDTSSTASIDAPPAVEVNVVPSDSAPVPVLEFVPNGLLKGCTQKLDVSAEPRTYSTNGSGIVDTPSSSDDITDLGTDTRILPLITANDRFIAGVLAAPDDISTKLPSSGPQPVKDEQLVKARVFQFTMPSFPASPEERQPVGLSAFLACIPKTVSESSTTVQVIKAPGNEVTELSRTNGAVTPAFFGDVLMLDQVPTPATQQLALTTSTVIKHAFPIQEESQAGTIPSVKPDFYPLIRATQAPTAAPNDASEPAITTVALTVPRKPLALKSSNEATDLTVSQATPDVAPSDESMAAMALLALGDLPTMTGAPPSFSDFKSLLQDADVQGPHVASSSAVIGPTAIVKSLPPALPATGAQIPVPDHLEQRLADVRIDSPVATEPTTVAQNTSSPRLRPSSLLERLTALQSGGASSAAAPVSMPPQAINAASFWGILPQSASAPLSVPTNFAKITADSTPIGPGNDPVSRQVDAARRRELGPRKTMANWLENQARELAAKRGSMMASSEKTSDSNVESIELPLIDFSSPLPQHRSSEQPANVEGVEGVDAIYNATSVSAPFDVVPVCEPPAADVVSLWGTLPTLEVESILPIQLQKIVTDPVAPIVNSTSVEAGSRQLGSAVRHKRATHKAAAAAKKPPPVASSDETHSESPGSVKSQSVPSGVSSNAAATSNSTSVGISLWNDVTTAVLAPTNLPAGFQSFARKPMPKLAPIVIESTTAELGHANARQALTNPDETNNLTSNASAIDTTATTTLCTEKDPDKEPEKPDKQRQSLRGLDHEAQNAVGVSDHVIFNPSPVALDANPSKNATHDGGVHDRQSHSTGLPGSTSNADVETFFQWSTNSPSAFNKSAASTINFSHALAISSTDPTTSNAFGAAAESSANGVAALSAIPTTTVQGSSNHCTAFDQSVQQGHIVQDPAKLLSLWSGSAFVPPPPSNFQYPSTGNLASTAGDVAQTGLDLLAQAAALAAMGPSPSDIQQFHMDMDQEDFLTPALLDTSQVQQSSSMPLAEYVNDIAMVQQGQQAWGTDLNTFQSNFPFTFAPSDAQHGWGHETQTSGPSQPQLVLDPFTTNIRNTQMWNLGLPEQNSIVTQQDQQLWNSDVHVTNPSPLPSAYASHTLESSHVAFPQAPSLWHQLDSLENNFTPAASAAAGETSPVNITLNDETVIWSLNPGDSSQAAQNPLRQADADVSALTFVAQEIQNYDQDAAFDAVSAALDAAPNVPNPYDFIDYTVEAHDQAVSATVSAAAIEQVGHIADSALSVQPQDSPQTESSVARNVPRYVPDIASPAAQGVTPTMLGMSVEQQQLLLAKHVKPKKMAEVVQPPSPDPPTDSPEGPATESLPSALGKRRERQDDDEYDIRYRRHSPEGETGS